MKGEKQVGLGFLGTGHPLAQGHVVVGASRQQHPVAVSRQQFTLQLAGDGHDDGLLLRAAYALRPGVPATMAGIEENQLWSRQRRGFLDRLWGRLVGPGVGTAQAEGRQARQGGKQMAAVNGRHGKRHFNVRGSLLFLRYLNLSTEVH